jgi:hypothetical protein
MLDDGARKFEIGIRNESRGVRSTDKIRCDVRWETGPPQNVSVVACNRTGVVEFWGRGKATPPMPWPEASDVPYYEFRNNCLF